MTRSTEIDYSYEAIPHVTDEDDEYESASEDVQYCTLINGNTDATEEYNRSMEAPEKFRNLAAYWFLGLTNNFSYVLMLSAAHDILLPSSGFETELSVDIAMNSSSTNLLGNNSRHCNVHSTGTILLADILPALIVKFVAPFIGLHQHFRVFCSFLLCTSSLLLVGLASSTSVAIVGVICASMSSGLGETTFLAYSAYYHRNVLSSWSSGTGGAGVFGSLCYAALTSLGMAPWQAVLSMLGVPVLMALNFWVVLIHPADKKCCRSHRHRQQFLLEAESGNFDTPRLNLKEKIQIIPNLFKYMIPLMLVYVGEYLINQGFLELVYFPSSFLSANEQYRWYQVIYQVGVLISRSSVNIFHFKRIWATSVFQWMNVILFLTLALSPWIGSIWLVFILILWEGLLGGAAYVNTFFRMANEVPRDEQEYANQVVSMSDTFGVSVAGLLAIPIHNAICQLPLW